MHEYSIVRALLDLVEKEARARGAGRVRRLHVQIGALAGVEIDLLQAAYGTFRQRTCCEGAELEIHPVAARWACRQCGRELTRGRRLECPSCGGRARLAQGDEIMLQRIEMEVPDVRDMRLR